MKRRQSRLNYIATMLWVPSSSYAFFISPPPPPPLHCSRKQMMTHDMHNRHCSDGYSYQQHRYYTIQQHLQLSATQSDNDDDGIPVSSKRSKRKRPTSNSNNQSTNNPSSTSTTNNRATFSTALCIIPPDNTWDTIQRARHLARDTTFYKWPPSIRLFHPFAPKYEISNLVGELASWFDDQNFDLYGTEFEGIFDDEYEVLLDEGMLIRDTTTSISSSSDENNNNDILSAFEITLDSIQILPHFEVLDARLEALEKDNTKQQTLDISIEEREYQKRKAESKKLIDEQIIMGKKRKKERERKKRLKQRLKMIENGEIDPYDTASSSSYNEDDIVEDDKTTNTEEEATTTDTKKNSYNGPCVIYLSPNDESRIKLSTLRERLRTDLFSMYDPFSPSSSVSPYPEQLPRRRPGQQGVKPQTVTDEEEKESQQFKPLLPIARFATVSEAVKVAKVLQQTWDPLTFNVTDLQFISRDDDSDKLVQQHGSSSGVGFGSTVPSSSKRGVGKKQQQQYESDIDDIPEVRHRRKHGTLSSSAASSHQRMALTTSGEVDDISKQGIYGCDAMVMLLGEEPEESIMDEEATLTMIMDDDDDDKEVGIDNESSDDLFRLEEDTNDGKINYNEIFTTAEREYQRMQAHEELSTASYVGDVPIFDESVTDIEAWLDDDDSDVDDDGATVVIGRAQFFMGAMREFVGMPASSAIDSKNRIMSGGANALSRRKGAVHRQAESWEEGDFGKR